MPCGTKSHELSTLAAEVPLLHRVQAASPPLHYHKDDSGTTYMEQGIIYQHGTMVNLSG